MGWSMQLFYSGKKHENKSRLFDMSNYDVPSKNHLKFLQRLPSLFPLLLEVLLGILQHFVDVWLIPANLRQKHHCVCLQSGSQPDICELQTSWKTLCASPPPDLNRLWRSERSERTSGASEADCGRGEDLKRSAAEPVSPFWPFLGVAPV